jgi:hypothetical protein
LSHERRTIVKWSDFDTAQQAILAKFQFDCRQSDRSKLLPPGYFAGGQYFDIAWAAQRGLHGTSAAIAVLGTSTSKQYRETVEGLVRYASDRSQIELAANLVPEQLEAWRVKLERDQTHIVKLGELLFALSRVQSGVAESEAFRTRLAESLMRSTVGGAWAYTKDDASQNPAMLPTADAIRGLAAHGCDVSAHASWLLAKLKDDAICDDPYVSSFALLVLVSEGLTDERTARPIFKKLCKVLLPEMDSRREVSRDFLDPQQRPNSVRVPWQLHIIALASLLTPITVFAKPRVQTRLNEIVSGVLSPTGFCYSEFGTNISTRTYFYIFDTLRIIQARGASANLVASVSSHMWRVLEKPTYVLVTLIRVATASGAIAFLALAARAWYSSKTSSIGDLGPNVVTASLLGFVSVMLRKFHRR